MTEPWEHVQWTGLIYGNPGTKKSFFGAGFPKPMKLFCFDPPAKALAYLQQGFATGIERDDAGNMRQYVYESVETRKRAGAEGLLIEISYFHDPIPSLLGKSKHLSGYERFQAELAQHTNEGWAGWASTLLDSYTFCELSAVRLEQYKMNPSAKDARQWYGGAKGHIQRDIMSTLIWAPCHVCVIAHVDPQRIDLQEKQKWGISAVGTLRGDLPGAFPEVYLMYEERREKQLFNWLMTESDGAYIAQTHIQAPNPCEPRWEALWTNQRSL